MFSLLTGIARMSTIRILLVSRSTAAKDCAINLDLPLTAVRGFFVQHETHQMDTKKQPAVASWSQGLRSFVRDAELRSGIRGCGLERVRPALPDWLPGSESAAGNGARSGGSGFGWRTRGALAFPSRGCF